MAAWLDGVLMRSYENASMFLLGFLIQVLVEFQWNALRALPTASLWLDLESGGLR